MTGFGVSPFGSCLMGIGAPADPSTVPDGLTSVSRWVDPITGDYEVDADGGQLRQMSGVLQRVILTIRTQAGSCLAAPKFGTTFPKKQTRQLEREINAKVREVLRSMTDTEGVMRVDAVTVETGDASRVAINLHYTNLLTGESEQIPVTI